MAYKTNALLKFMDIYTQIIAQLQPETMRSEFSSSPSPIPHTARDESLHGSKGPSKVSRGECFNHPRVQKLQAF